MLKPAQPLSDADLDKPDDELGHWLFETWCAYHAEQHGVPLDAVSDEWIAVIRAKSLEMDSDSTENAPIESAFRKAAKGDFAAAGRMLRDYVLSGAYARVAKKYAPIGIEQTRLRILGGHASAGKRAKGAKAWQDKCIEHAKVLLSTGTAPHELAGKCSAKFKRSADTIRRLLKKAGVK